MLTRHRAQRCLISLYKLIPFLALTVLAASANAQTPACSTSGDTSLGGLADDLSDVCEGAACESVSGSEFSPTGDMVSNKPQPSVPPGPRCLYAGPHCESIPLAPLDSTGLGLLGWSRGSGQAPRCIRGYLPMKWGFDYQGVSSQWTPNRTGPPPRSI